MTTKTQIQFLRWIGKTEGISYLLLIGIAMPLKYLTGFPAAVSVVGMIHGILFLVFCYALFRAWLETPLTLPWAVYSFIASLLPFGPFVIDSRLGQFDNANSEQASISSGPN